MQFRRRARSSYFLVDSDVEHVGRVTGLGPQNVHAIVADEQADRALRIVAIAENARADRARLHAGGLQPLGDPVVAPRALLRGPGAHVEIARAVGAGLHAVLAADAVLAVDENDAVPGPVGRARRAHLDAGRMLALVAQLRDEKRLF